MAASTYRLRPTDLSLFAVMGLFLGTTFFYFEISLIVWPPLTVVAIRLVLASMVLWMLVLVYFLTVDGCLSSLKTLAVATGIGIVCLMISPSAFAALDPTFVGQTIFLSISIMLALALYSVLPKPTVCTFMMATAFSASVSAQAVVERTNDACDRRDLVTFVEFGFGESVGPNETRVFNLPNATRDLVWYCGNELEFVRNSDRSFDRIQISRAGNGAISWILFDRGELGRREYIDSPGQGVAELHMWYSRERKDFDTRTDAQWTGRLGEIASPDYRYVGSQGFVPGPASGPATGLVPLHRWWNASNQDNIISAHPAWRGGPGVINGSNEWQAIDGWAFEDPLAGTVPIFSRWHQFNSDTVTGSFAQFAAGPPAERLKGYTAPYLQGWVVPNSGTQLDLLDEFGHAAAPAIKRDMKVLVIRQTHSDRTPQLSDDEIHQLFFGLEYPSLRGLYDVVSDGRINLEPAGIVSVNMSTTLAQATAAESQDDGDALRLANAGFDFRTLDTDGDGNVEADEALIVKFISQGECAQQRSAPQIELDGVRLTTVGFTAAGDLEHWHVYAEELGHVFAFFDLYGPNPPTLNRQASFMGDNCSRARNAANGPYLLDPWHRMLAGWLQPRLHPINEAGGFAVISSADTITRTTPPNNRPILFYDPTRALDEFFIVEHRSPSSPTGYDAGALNEGVAVWHVNLQVNDRSKPEKLVWPQPWGPWAPAAPNGGNMSAIYYIGTGTNQFGAGNFWRPETAQSRQLNWADGTDSGLRLTVESTDEERSSISWSYKDRPLRYRLDAARVDGQRRVLFEGQFSAVADLQVVRQEPDGALTPLGSVAGPFDNVGTRRIPSAASCGNHVALLNRADNSALSNFVVVQC